MQIAVGYDFNIDIHWGFWFYHGCFGRVATDKDSWQQNCKDYEQTYLFFHSFLLEAKNVDYKYLSN